MFTITYQTPYNDCEWRFQSFSTLNEATLREMEKDVMMQHQAVDAF